MLRCAFVVGLDKGKDELFLSEDLMFKFPSLISFFSVGERKEEAR